ncbi:MAG: dienelactone hydrolase family protein [Alphaproteobacteria bacterium]|nr:dienelactone hydrolase family protein [Alphaproteobacteria bacterium]
MLTDYRIPPATGGNPGRVVIFLHGVGDSGSGGLLSIGQMWQRALPDCEFLCPDAPFPFDMAPPDFGGRQWFSLQDRSPQKVMTGVQTAAPLLNDYIDHVLKTRELTPDHLALVGFSQGTMMALHVAPRRAKPLAGVIGYSGLLADNGALATEKKSSPSILLVHGTQDEVVPYTMLALAEKGLAAADIPVRAVTCPGIGHTIDDRGLVEGLAFLKANLR